MKYIISRTDDGVITYPLHYHENFEIMFYVEGEGFLHTHTRDYPFKPGTAIIVPPNISHGSVSQNGFKNICVQGNFNHIFIFDEPKIVLDNSEDDGKFLANCIYRNRLNDNALLYSLIETFAHFLSCNIELENETARAVDDIIIKIGENAENCDFSVAELLKNSGYAEDYIRMCFTQKTGIPPVKFLNMVRIERATNLINIYKNEISLATIAEKSGFQDYSYFSRKFKQNKGVSPKEYLNKIHLQNNEKL